MLLALGSAGTRISTAPVQRDGNAYPGSDSAKNKHSPEGRYSATTGSSASASAVARRDGRARRDSCAAHDRVAIDLYGLVAARREPAQFLWHGDHLQRYQTRRGGQSHDRMKREQAKDQKYGCEF